MTKKYHDKNVLDLLYRSFDGDLTPGQKELLAKALEQSADLQTEQQRIAAMRRIVAEKGGGSFAPFFGTRVMRRINTIQTLPDRTTEFFDSMVHVFRQVALVGGIAVIVLFTVQLLHKDKEINLASETISEMTLDEVLGSAFSTSLEEVL